MLPLLLLWFTASRIAGAQTTEQLIEQLGHFDISCKIVDEKFQKKTCGITRIETFVKLIATDDEASVLAVVEEAAKAAKARLKEIKSIEGTEPDESKIEEYRKIIAVAQEGDAENIALLGAIENIEIIPYLIEIGGLEGTLPSKEIRGKLAELEIIVDEKIATGGEGLDTRTLESIIQREKSYAASLKRAVIALEGTRRKFPPWLPFAYTYLLGLVPFIAGIIASIKYYGKLEPRVTLIVVVSYLFYVSLHGFFQFVAPYI